jgi:hypothetical protein
MPKTTQSIVIAAPADRVWPAVRNFHDVSWAPGVLTKCDVVGEHKGDQIGARRVLNDAFHETLVALDDVDRSMKYSLDDGPSPVSAQEVRHFVARLHVLPITATDQSLLEISASWEEDGDAVRSFASGIYEAILAAARDALGA